MSVGRGAQYSAQIGRGATAFMNVTASTAGWPPFWRTGSDPSTTSLRFWFELSICRCRSLLQIPLTGFAQPTMFATAIGVVLAVLSRRPGHPRCAFVRSAVALTVLSLVPDVLIDT